MVRNSFTLEFFISNFDLELVPKKPTSRIFRSEVSTHDLARYSDGDNRRTCHLTVYCFSPENVVYLWEYTFYTKFLVCSLNRVQVVLNRNGRKDGGQQ